MQTFRNSERISSDAFSNVSEVDPETILPTKYLPRMMVLYLAGGRSAPWTSILPFMGDSKAEWHPSGPESTIAGLSACQIDLGFAH
jgi:hypothetical protein